jgi:hypothetical protein
MGTIKFLNKLFKIDFLEDPNLIAKTGKQGKKANNVPEATNATMDES